MDTLSTYPEGYEIISKSEGTYTVIDGTYTHIDNCGGYGSHINCASHGIPIKISDVLIPIIIYLGIVAIISFFVALCFYFVYKHKKEKNPWKHAIRKSWPWWIVIFCILFFVPGIGLWTKF